MQLLRESGVSWTEAGSGAWSEARWTGMGRRGRLSALDVCKLLALLLLLCPSVSLQCKILKCNSEFWASTGHSGPEEEFCVALRAYNSCVRKTARNCRGDLAYHSAQHGIEDLMIQHNCSKEGPSSAPPAPPQALPPPPPPPQERSDGPEVCQYERGLPRGAPPPNYTHCGFFGDPHLRTFGDHFHTCKVEGAWPLIHNKYLSVQVTNTPVVPGAMATATSKLTIIFKNFQECVDQKTYHAETDELPAAFADGSKNGGERHGANTLRIVEKAPGAHVEIQARYIGTTIVVRQVGRYLTFAVRMPEEVVRAAEEGDAQDLYLCLHGCPSNQRIPLSRTLTRTLRAPGRGRAPQGLSYHTAKAKCKERLPVEDLYFESCVFDLLSSGDTNFTMAAFYAFEDVKTLHSNSQRHHLYEEEQRSRAIAAPLSVLLLTLCALLLWGL